MFLAMQEGGASQLKVEGRKREEAVNQLHVEKKVW